MGGSRDVHRCIGGREGKTAGEHLQRGTSVGGDDGMAIVYAALELNDSLRPAPPLPPASIHSPNKI